VLRPLTSAAAPSAEARTPVRMFACASINNGSTNDLLIFGVRVRMNVKQKKYGRVS
jgi:hypothetical protein